MNKGDFAFFMQSYTLEHTKRYSMKPVIHQESVATHSFFVALGVLMLSKDYTFDLDLAIKIALCHDLAEMEISDVNHMVKKNFPVVAEALKEAEEQIVQGFPDQVRNYCSMYHEKSPEALIVHYADALQCLQYSTNEIELGNSGYMVDVFDNSNKRLDELKKKLESYERMP
jgi:5'-deoxynucleotidase YfbR-like HD superfamily hydrolase